MSVFVGKKNTYLVRHHAMEALRYRCRNQEEKAVQSWQTALEHVAEDRRSDLEPLVRFKFGSYLATLGRPKEALDQFQEELRLLQLSNPSVAKPLKICKTMVRIGLVLQSLERSTEACQSLKEATQALIGTSYEKTLEATKAWEKLAEVQFHENAREDALASLQKALDICIADEGEFPRRRKTATLYETLGDYSSANNGVPHWEKAVEIYRRGGSSNEEAIAFLLNKIDDNRA